MKAIKCLNILCLISIVFCFSAFSSYAAEDAGCIACHEDVRKPGKSIHPTVNMGCSTCHKSVEGKSHPDQKGSVVLTQKIPGLCYGCHDESKFRGKSGHTLLGMCTGCHDPHRSDSAKLLRSDQPGVCYDCHDRTKFTKKYLHKIINVGGCSSCHAAHISDNPSLLLNSLHDLCISCHIKVLREPHVVAMPGGRKKHPITKVIDPSTLKLIKQPDPRNPKRQIDVPDPNVPGKEMTCASCHDPHSSDFGSLLTQQKICTKCHKL